MTARELLKKAQSEPIANDVNWVQYKPIYFTLLDKGYSKINAVRYIIRNLGKPGSDVKRLKDASARWRREGE